MEKLKLIMIMLMMLPEIAFSQNLSITKVQRDSIVHKIIRGNEALETVKVLKKQVVQRDSIIAMHNELFTVCQNSLDTQKQIIANLNSIVINKDEILKKEKKIARRKKFGGIIKGAGAGVILGFLLFN